MHLYKELPKFDVNATIAQRLYHSNSSNKGGPNLKTHVICFNRRRNKGITFGIVMLGASLLKRKLWKYLRKQELNL